MAWFWVRGLYNNAQQALCFFYGSQAKRYLDRIITLLVYVLFFPVVALILFLPLGYLVNEYQEGSVDMILRILIYAFLVFLSALFMASVVSALLPQYTVVTDHSVLIKRHNIMYYHLKRGTSDFIPIQQISSIQPATPWRCKYAPVPATVYAWKYMVEIHANEQIYYVPVEDVRCIYWWCQGAPPASEMNSGRFLVPKRGAVLVPIGQIPCTTQ